MCIERFIHKRKVVPFFLFHAVYSYSYSLVYKLQKQVSAATVPLMGLGTPNSKLLLIRAAPASKRLEPEVR